MPAYSRTLINASEGMHITKMESYLKYLGKIFTHILFQTRIWMLKALTTMTITETTRTMRMMKTARVHKMMTQVNI